MKPSTGNSPPPAQSDNHASIAWMIHYGYEVFRSNQLDEVARRFGERRKQALWGYTCLGSPGSDQRIMLRWPNGVFAFGTETDIRDPKRLISKYIASGFGSGRPLQTLTASCLPIPRGQGNN